MTKRRSQYEHDRMIRNILPYIAPRGYQNIKADLPGHEPPTPIGAHTPDISADGLLIEVETSDSINDAHTEAQWKAFAEHAAETQGRFIVVVPKGDVAAAQKRLEELQITADIWTAA